MSDDADNKVINVAKLFSSHADKFGFKVGEKLPDLLENLLNGFVKRDQIGKNFEELVPGSHVLISKAIEFLANVLELPKEKVKKLVPGFLGDVLHETINEAIDAMGRGAGEAPKDGKKPDKGDKTADAVKLDPGSMKGFVLGGQLHKSNCTTAERPRGKFKGDKPPEDITVLDALKRRHALSYCGCWGSPSEVEELEAQVKAAIAPAATAKVETKAEAPASKPESKPGSGTLFSLLMRLREEEPHMFAQVHDLYRSLTAKDMDLKKKFFVVFHNNGSYDDLRRLFEQPNDLWDEWLSDYIGEPTPEKRTLLQREQEQFDRMFDAIFEQVEKFSTWCRGVSSELRSSTAAFKAECAARDKKRRRRAKAVKIGVSFCALVGTICYFALINHPF